MTESRMYRGWCSNCCLWWPRHPPGRCPACRVKLIEKAQPRRFPELRPGVTAEWDDEIERMTTDGP